MGGLRRGRDKVTPIGKTFRKHVKSSVKNTPEGRKSNDGDRQGGNNNEFRDFCSNESERQYFNYVIH